MPLLSIADSFRLSNKARHLHPAEALMIDATKDKILENDYRSSQVASRVGETDRWSKADDEQTLQAAV